MSTPRLVAREDGADAASAARDEFLALYGNGRPATDALITALRLNIGPKPRRWTADQIAEATGIAKRKLYGIMAGETRPQGDEIVLLAALLGQASMSAVLHPYGYRAVPLEDAAGCPYEALGATLKTATRLAEATSPDGPGGQRITHAEAARLVSEIDETEDALRRLRTQLRREHGL